MDDISDYYANDETKIYELESEIALIIVNCNAAGRISGQGDSMIDIQCPAALRLSVARTILLVLCLEFHLRSLMYVQTKKYVSTCIINRRFVRPLSKVRLRFAPEKTFPTKLVEHSEPTFVL